MKRLRLMYLRPAAHAHAHSHSDSHLISSRFEDGRKWSRVLRLIGALHAAAQADEKPGAGGWRFDMLEKLAGGGERRYFRKEIVLLVSNLLKRKHELEVGEARAISLIFCFSVPWCLSLDERFNVVQLDGKRQWLVQIRWFWDMPATFLNSEQRRRIKQP